MLATGFPSSWDCLFSQAPRCVRSWKASGSGGCAPHLRAPEAFMRAEHNQRHVSTRQSWKPLRRNRSALLLWFAALTAVAAVVAYYTVFTGFQTYDDEGALMTSVNQILD